MNYTQLLDSELGRPAPVGPLVVDLFAGCGGLALGFEAAGFETVGFEMDADAAATYRHNLEGDCHEVFLTPETDLPAAPIVMGGPPCQPFSAAGKQSGLEDSRDGFPAFLGAVKRLQPELCLFENVRGMMYRNKDYFLAIQRALADLGYVVEVRLLNAVNFGVPQNRERVICVGHRGSFDWPTEQAVRVSAGEALGPLANHVPSDAKFLTPSMDAYIARYEEASKCVTPRDLHLDRPARTLTTRNLSGATSDMHRIRLPDGRRRMLQVREAARLQSFPDWFEFFGTESSAMKQIGNSVAPLFAKQLALAARRYLESTTRLSAEDVAAKRPRRAVQEQLLA